MLTRSGARRAVQAAQAADSGQTSRGAIPSVDFDARSKRGSSVPKGDDTDLDELEMEVIDDADFEDDDDLGTDGEGDREVVFRHQQTQAGKSVTERQSIMVNRDRSSLGRTEGRDGERRGKSKPTLDEELNFVTHQSGHRRRRRGETDVRRADQEGTGVVDDRGDVGPYYERDRLSHRWIKPEKFTATTSVESYISHFESIAEYNGWNARDKAAYLKAALTGDAAQLLWDAGSHSVISYDDLVSKLRARFGSADFRERFACQLRALRRGQGQTLQQLYNEVRKLLALAYPDAATSSLGEVIARDAFLSALNDRELEIKVRDREPTDLDSAFRAAMRIETYLRPVEESRRADSESERESTGRYPRRRYEEQRARQIVEAAKPPVDETASALRELREQLEESRKSQLELSRELGKLRLATEARLEVRQERTEAPAPAAHLSHAEGGASRPSRTIRTERTCYVCGDPSHLARGCPNKRTQVGKDEKKEDGNAEGNRNSGYGGGAVRGLTGQKGGRAAYIRMCIGGNFVDCLLDTGSEVCIFPTRFASAGRMRPVQHRLFAANGTAIAVAGEILITAAIGSLEFDITGFCSDNVAEIIFGLDFLRDSEATWDFGAAEIIIRGERFRLLEREATNVCRRILLEETAVIPPRSEMVLPAYAEMKGGLRSTGLWATKTRQVVNKIYAASVVLPERVVDIPVRVLNTSLEPITLKAGTELTTAERVTMGDEDVDDAMLVDDGIRSRTIKQMVDMVDDDVSQEVRNELIRILEEHAEAFSFHDLDIGHASASQHRIEVGDAQPVRQRLRRQPPAHQAAINTHIDDMLRQGIIEEAQSPWAANLVVVKKKTGEYRCCADFRGLNAVTLKDAYSLPRIDACLDALAGAQWFSSFDLRNSYYQVEVSPEDRDKTAFICRNGQFRFIRMPMGLCNSGATFQRLVDIVLSGLAYEVCLAYIDDILIYSKTIEEHLSRLRIVLGRLKEAGLRVKPSKTHLMRKSVGFLGHLISSEGVSAHPEKTEQILNWGVPCSVRDVRAFIGITSYYRKFVKNYAEIASPIISLTKKNQRFVWTEQCQNSFEELKRALINPPILAMPIDGGQYVLDTDSSDFAIGAVLSQVQNGEEKVIAYASRRLSMRERNYCVTRRELLAVVHYLKYFRHYLLGAPQPTKIRTDHAAIQWLRRIPEPVGQQARWLETMEEYDVIIQHRAGRSHGNADAMSRDPCHNRRCCPWTEGMAQQVAMITLKVGNRDGEVVTAWAEGGTAVENDETSAADEELSGTNEAFELRAVSEPNLGQDQGGTVSLDWSTETWLEHQKKDVQLSNIIQWLSQGTERPSWDQIAPLSEFTKILWRQWERLELRDGVLIRRFESADGREKINQVIIPQHLRTAFLSAVHAGVAGGHFGRHRTELAVKARAYWPGWAGDVRRALQTCEACNKYMRGKPPRRAPLKPILCGEPWELISLDITGPHPVSRQGFVYILTIQDHFTKWAEAVPIRRHTAPIVARAVFEYIFMRYGACRRILTDQGPEFESGLMYELCRLMGVEKLRTSPYHPQCNGMLERFHRVLNTLLAKVVANNQKDWADHLPTVMAAYRASVHEATGFSPNYLMLGRETRLPIDVVFGVPPDRQHEPQAYCDFVAECADRMRKDFQTVRDRLASLAQVRRDRYDIKRQPDPLIPGQKVWYFCPRRKTNLSPKWQNFYTGPYTVVRVIDPHVVAIERNRRSRPITVHRDKLKPVVESGEVGISTRPLSGTQSDSEADNAGGRDRRNSRPMRERRRPRKFDDCCVVRCASNPTGRITVGGSTGKRGRPDLQTEGAGREAAHESVVRRVVVVRTEGTTAPGGTSEVFVVDTATADGARVVRRVRSVVHDEADQRSGDVADQAECTPNVVEQAHAESRLREQFDQREIVPEPAAEIAISTGSEDVGARYECALCAAAFRDERDLRRHRTSQSHAARARGDEPPRVSRGGLLRGGRRRVSQSDRADASGVIVAPAAVGSGPSEGHQSTDRRDNEPATALANVEALLDATDAMGVGAHVNADGDADSVLDAMAAVKLWYLSIGEAADDFARVCAGSHDTTIADVVADRVLAFGAVARQEALWLEAVVDRSVNSIPAVGDSNYGGTSREARLMGFAPLNAEPVSGDFES